MSSTLRSALVFASVASLTGIASAHVGISSGPAGANKTAIITFDDLGDGTTRYTARVQHWSAEDRDAHETMGFHAGWGQCADQLAALVATL